MFAKMNSLLKYSFFGVDLRAVALFRIALGLVLILDLFFNRIPILKELYVDSGYMTADSISTLTGNFRLSALSYITSTSGVKLFFGAYLIACLLFLVGFKTRVLSIVLWYMLFSIQERTFPFLYGADFVLISAVLWSIFLPLNARFSLFKSKESLPNKYIDIAVFAVLLQIGLIYFFNSLFKSGETWKEGSAISYALSVFEHHTYYSDWLLSNPSLATFLTYYTKWFELLIPFLIFFPIKTGTTRLIAAFIILSFHFGLIPFLDVGTFYLSTLPFVFFLIPGSFFDKLNTIARGKDH